MANVLGFNVTCNKVNAEIYIINMIVGSYFTQNRKVDKKMSEKRIDYSLLKKDKQLEAEKELIEKMEDLGTDIQKKLSSLRYDLQIFTEGKDTVVGFRTGFEEILCRIDNRGKLRGFSLIEG